MDLYNLVKFIHCQTTHLPSDQTDASWFVMSSDKQTTTTESISTLGSVQISWETLFFGDCSLFWSISWSCTDINCCQKNSQKGFATQCQLPVKLHVISLTSTWFVILILRCSLAVLDPRVGHTMDVLSPSIPVLCHSDWLFHGESCPCLDVVHPGRAWPSSPSCTWHCSLHYLFLQATPLFPHGVTIVC